MYKVVYIDDSVFEGGKVNNSLWNLIEDKEIKRIEYSLYNKTIILENYEAYNHIVKRAKFFNKEERITQVYLMGKNKNYVERFIFDFIKNRFDCDVVEFGKEFNDKSTNGWKKGIPALKPSHQIL